VRALLNRWVRAAVATPVASVPATTPVASVHATIPVANNLNEFGVTTSNAIFRAMTLVANILNEIWCH